MPRPRIVKSSGNVFADLGFPPEEASLLAMRAELMALLRETIARRGWTQVEVGRASRWLVGYRRLEAPVQALRRARQLRPNLPKQIRSPHGDRNEHLGSLGGRSAALLPLLQGAS